MQYLTRKRVASVRWNCGCWRCCRCCCCCCCCKCGCCNSCCCRIAVLVIINADANMSNVVNINHRQRKNPATGALFHQSIELLTANCNGNQLLLLHGDTLATWPLGYFAGSRQQFIICALPASTWPTRTRCQTRTTQIRIRIRDPNLILIRILIPIRMQRLLANSRDSRAWLL